MLAAPEMTDERRDELIRRFAAWVVKRRLETPAIFMLETHRPLAVVGANAAYFGAPILGPLFGEKVFAEIGTLIEDRANITRLVDEIERMSSERDSAGKGA